MMKKQQTWGLLLLSLCVFALQGCLGSPGTKSVGQGTNGNTVSVVQNAFSGKIYATIGHNLYVITGDGTSKELASGGNIYDPAVSPNGKQVAFVRRFKQYSDLAIVSSSGGTVRTLISGHGHFFYNSAGFVHNNFYWFFEPSWSPDGSKLLFLSDLMKLDYAHQCHAQDADLLDLQAFIIPVKSPTTPPVPVAYATFGGGGDRDASFNPTNSNQVVYTHYADIASDGSKQQIQIMLADPRLITNNPGTYCAGSSTSSGIAITSSKDQNIQPSYSPDGQSLAFVKNNSSSSTSTSIYILTLPGGVTSKPLDAATQQTALQPYKKAVKLLNGVYASRPTWSPDGKQMAYLIEQNEELDLWVVSIAKDPGTGLYSVKGSATQVTTGGIDGDSRFDWIA